MHHRLVILGSTGSIGTSTLDVVAGLRRQGLDVSVVGLAASTKVQAICQQARELSPPLISLADDRAAVAARSALVGTSTRVLGGAAGLVELVNIARAEYKADLVVAGIVGAAGLPAVLAAAELGCDIALANKEALVVGGALLVPICQRTGARLLPVDSEHSAIFQCLAAGRRSEVQRLILTASGGPFRTWSAEQLRHATPADALKHPTWAMGPKITIDSATMMNKAIELLEACWLFDIEESQIDVLIHPQSVVHSMVEFVDGSVIAQLGTPDMCTPIQYAITYPQRLAGVANHIHWAGLRSLTFEPPDDERFPAVSLARGVARQVRAGGAGCPTAGAVFNAANEVANEAFRAGRLGFCEIAEVVGNAVRELCHVTPASTARADLDTNGGLAELLAADARARRWCLEFVA